MSEINEMVTKKNSADFLNDDLLDMVIEMNSREKTNPDYCFLRVEDLEAMSKGDGKVGVVKFFNPMGVGTWIISEMDKDGYCFGAAELGGRYEMGSISLKELMSIDLPMGMKIERDMYFEKGNLVEMLVELNKGRSW